MFGQSSSQCESLISRLVSTINDILTAMNTETCGPLNRYLATLVSMTHLAGFCSVFIELNGIETLVSLKSQFTKGDPNNWFESLNPGGGQNTEDQRDSDWDRCDIDEEHRFGGRRMEVVSWENEHLETYHIPLSTSSENDRTHTLNVLDELRTIPDNSHCCWFPLLTSSMTNMQTPESLKIDALVNLKVEREVEKAMKQREHQCKLNPYSCEMPNPETERSRAEKRVLHEMFSDLWKQMNPLSQMPDLYSMSVEKVRMRLHELANLKAATEQGGIDSLSM
ncbi:hypothetical protein BLNAU_7726 [Blattamonas nauphoetae]|uniref:Uncharacterized protein n=1 Tax=Blattamonas nauphoetae TaxID=2049346 RepID=A0ABQ9Y0S4_9EUKA|nr:hypothetical protein BLNAU_7726 [Blattamonas nauphoetae]